jgi:7-cyano-7-deazaguanine synthase
MEQTNYKAIVLFSGGLDSFCALHWARDKWGADNVAALFLDFGHKYSLRECLTVGRFCDLLGAKLIQRNVPIGDQEDPITYHLQLRNTFALLTASYYSNNIVFGTLYRELSEDCTPKFVKSIQNLLRSQYKANIFHDEKVMTIHTPFINTTKTEMVEWYLKEKGYLSQILLETISCYKATGTVKQCGQCASCLQRWIALANNHLMEEFEGKPWEWALEQLKKPGTKVWSLRLIIWKRKHLWETYKAFKTVIKDPLRTILKIYRLREV